MATLNQRAVIVTGANRGLGAALVTALLKYPVARVYAAARKPETIRELDDARVVPFTLDITNDAQIAALQAQARDVTVLINNAGVNRFGSLLTQSFANIEQEMNTNYYGTLKMIRAFYPIIEANGGGNIVNIVSICGLASMPGLGGYSASKAALFSATQALRTDLKNKHIRVHSVFPGPIDTDMNEGLDIRMETPMNTAERIIESVLRDVEDIFPDPVGEQVGRDWRADPKMLEQRFSQYR